METQNIARRYDLDWLRVLVIAMLIPFHAAVIFDLGGEFFVLNNTHSTALAAFTDSVGAWGMQLLFFVAGASSWFMLRKYSWKKFILRRILRLVLPLCFAMLTIIPVMGYFGFLHHTGSDISFLRYYPKFFTIDANDYAGYLGHFTPGHQWFVLFLFVMLLVALPLFAWLNGVKGQRVTSLITLFLSKPGAVFVVPIVFFFLDGLPEVTERNIATFFVLLVLGFIWMSDQRLQDRVDRQKYALAFFAIVLGILWTVLQKWGELQVGPSLGASAFDLLHDTYTWTVILALLSLSHSFLNRQSRAISYLGPASYPIYIIHLPMVIAVGYFVVQWEAAIAIKFAVIVFCSFVAIMAVYDLLIRRVKFVGRVMGVK